MKRLFTCLLFTVIFLSPSLVRAQLITSPDTTVCPGTILTLYANSATPFTLAVDDQMSGWIPLGFTFNFYGVDYTQCLISSNGYITFSGTPSSYSAWSITSGVPGNVNVANSIMPSYGDYYPGLGGVVSYATAGVAPNRKFVVTWCSVPMFSCTSTLATFQCILYEGTNEIDLMIQDSPLCSSWNGGAKIQGVQNAAATAGTTTPGRNYPTLWTATNDGKHYAPSGTTSFTVTDIPFALAPINPSVTWYENGTLNIGTGASVTVAPVVSTFYVAVPSSASGCYSTVASDTVYVTTVTPAGPTVVSPITFCQYSSASPLTATVSTGGTLTWYTAATGGTGTSSITPVTTTPGTDTFYVSETIGSCESSRTPLIVNITSQPAAPVVVTPLTYCQFETAAPLTATGTSLLYYYTPVGGLGSASITPSTSGAGTTGYYVTQTVSGCESQRSEIDVTVNPTPAAPTVVSPVVYCQDEPTSQLATTSGSNLTWYTSSSDTVGSPTAPTPSSTYPGSTIYYVSQTIGTCEGVKAPLTVTINPTPALPVVASPLYLCQLEPSGPLSATGSNLLWYADSTGGVGDPVAPTPSTATPVTITYYVSQTILGCEGPRKAFTVVVKPKPGIPSVTDTTTYCQYDQPAQLGAGGTNLTWYNYPVGGAGNPVAPVPSTAYAGITSYYVSQTVNGCESDRSTTVVKVNPAVDATFTMSKTNPCLSDTISVEFNGVSGLNATYTWDFSNAIVMSGSGTGPYNISWNQTGPSSISLTVSELGCSDTKTASFNVGTPITPNFDIPDDICINDMLSVQAGWNSTGAESYNWDFDNASISYGYGEGLYLMNWQTSGQKIVKMTLVKDGCRSYPSSDTIMVHDLPIANILTTIPGLVCEGDTLHLFADYQPGYNYTWTPGEFMLGEGNSGAMSVIARSTSVITLVVSDSFKCKSTTSAMLNTEPCCVVSLPSGFTPNNDGRNDMFHVITTGHQEIVTFRVTNRWGQTVYETHAEDKGWDGTFSGLPQDMGVYYWYLKYKCNGKEKEMTGDIMLVR